MRCLIIDDELSARSRLKRLLGAHSDVEIVGEAEDGVEALERIEALKPDLIFLDIEMPSLNGFQMLEAIPSNHALPLVIFTTGYDEHALAAFEADALAYLLKPIEEHRLDSALNRARQLVLDSAGSTEEGRRIGNLVRRMPMRVDHVVCKLRGRFILLRPSEIVYFSAESGVVKVHTVSDVFHIERTLNALEEGLSSQRFFRSHRATLVNLMHVGEIEPHFRSSYMLIMRDDARSQIQVSERQAKLLRDLMPGL